MAKMRQISSTEMIEATFYPWSTKQVFRVAHVISAQTFLKKCLHFQNRVHFPPCKDHTLKRML